MAITKDEVTERVKNITARILNIDPDQIKLESRFAADLGAESIQSSELVASFEEEFNIDMDEDEALAVTNVGKAVDFVYENVLKQHG